MPQLNWTTWQRHLLPLPHEITLEGTIECHPGEVAVKTTPNPSAVERQAADELSQLIARKGEKKNFEILLGTVDDTGHLADTKVDVDRLASSPNSDQAYLIFPQGDRQLVLAALGERGVYHAARTLYQLLAAQIQAERIVVPLVRVVDWPDIEERGLWNFPDEKTWIPWLSSIKLNYGKMANTQLAPIEALKPNRATIEVELMQMAKKQAFNYLPYILHLNFLHDCGLFKTYPQLAGRGDGALAGRYFAHKQGNQHRVPCASQPKLVDIIAEWMGSIAAQGGLEISCWLSERPAQCGCDACSAIGQFVLEARAFVKAWQRVRAEYPSLQIRLFLSTTTAERDYRILAETPAEVKIERACATAMEQVLHWPRDLCANPLLDHCAATGRWIASYDVPIGVNGKVDTPEFKLPERSAHRIKDYVSQLLRRRYSGAYGMIAWGKLAREINGFNIEALAEWSWNTAGRSEADFALAWATRQGFAQPDQVSRWAELIGPVEFDVYDSDFPTCYSQGKAVQMVRDKQRPYLGEGIFRYYGDEAAFEHKKSICDQALAIAAQLEDPDFANETRVVATYVELAQGIYQVAELTTTADLGQTDNQKALLAAVEQLEAAGAANQEAIRAWRGALGPEPWHYRVEDALAATATTVAEIGRFVRERHLY